MYVPGLVCGGWNYNIGRRFEGERRGVLNTPGGVNMCLKNSENKGVNVGKIFCTLSVDFSVSLLTNRITHLLENPLYMTV